MAVASLLRGNIRPSFLESAPLPWLPRQVLDFMYVFLYNAFDEKKETFCSKHTSYIRNTKH